MRWLRAPPRGEITLVIEGATPAEAEVDAPALARAVSSAIAGGATKKDAIADVARAARVPKRIVYQAVLDALE